jgi:polar amino acid transport system permease protein
MIDFLFVNGSQILEGFWNTIRIVLFGFSIGVLFGAPLGLARQSRFLLPRIIVDTYVELIRNTPFLIQASLLFALVGVLRLRLPMDLLGAAAVALYTGAYMAEIVRGALLAVPDGQWEAADALGLSKVQAFRLVILPQLMPFALPASTNLFATVTKESAFLAALSVAELTFAGQVVIARTFAVFEVWAVVGALYLTFILTLFAISERLERRFAWAHQTRH